jgi:hypothetical protein
MIHPREKIKFVRVTQTQDSSGNLVNSEVVFYAPKAVVVQELKPSVDLIVQQQNISQLIKVTLRYNPEVSIINGDKILWRSFRFNALAPKVDRFRKYIEIMAFSEIETTDRQSGIPTTLNTLDSTLEFQL